MPKAWTPAQLFEKLEQGERQKAALGEKGLAEQSRVNRRFYRGDQWHGAQGGGDRPLVRHNLIRRIGDYKMAVVGAKPVTVSYSAEGVPNTLALQKRVQKEREKLAASGATRQKIFGKQLADPAEIALVMGALSDYFKVTARRLDLDLLRQQALKNAYLTGTGVLYTYWDPTLRTGLYADGQMRHPIKGDIGCQLLDIEAVCFGDPAISQLQEQPYLLITQKMDTDAVRRQAAFYGADDETIASITHEDDPFGETSGEKTTLVTRFWKEWDAQAGKLAVYSQSACRKAAVQPAQKLPIDCYPFAVFTWEQPDDSAYGVSEITHLIPNQIAVNRMLTAGVWACMMMGMPMMVVNGDVITEPITNDPAQIIKVSGPVEDVQQAIRFVQPPNFSANFETLTSSLIAGTLTQAGANDAALGDMRADNTSAIIAVREAATMPLQLVQNRYLGFCREIARIWAAFWIGCYGIRSLKIEEEGSSWYFPFDGDRYKDLVISARIDVGAATAWSEAQTVQTLDNLLAKGIITVPQYLERLPDGLVPDLSGLKRAIGQTLPNQAATPEIMAEEAQGL